MITQIICAFIGTIAFALLFSVPKKDYIPAGIIGALGWTVYCALTELGLSDVPTSFFATITVAVCARYFAVIFRAPSIVFLIPGVFPLVPGGKIFWAVYYFMIGSSGKAVSCGADAFRCAFIIVLGIMSVLHLPERIFKCVSEWKWGKNIHYHHNR